MNSLRIPLSNTSFSQSIFVQFKVSTIVSVILGDYMLLLGEELTLQKHTKF